MKRIAINCTSILFLSCFSLLAHGQTWEVYNSKFELQSRLIYDSVDLLSESVRIGTINSELFLLSPDLRPSLKLEGNSVYQYLAPWILMKGIGGIGAYHEYGQKILNLEYEEISTYYNYLLARKGNDYWVFEKGKNKITQIGNFDEAKFTKLGLLIARSGPEYYLPLSKNPAKVFNYLEDNDGRYVLAKEDSGYGLINLEGDYVLDPVLEKLTHTTGDFFYGFNENQYLLIEGNDIKANIRYNSFHTITYENGILLEYIYGKLRRVMEEDGILLDSVGIESVAQIDKNLYNVRFRGDKVGLLGKNGWLVSPTKNTDKIHFGGENLYPAQFNGQTGFLNPSGNWIIQPIWLEVKGFSDQIAAVRANKSGDWNIINSSGEIISSSTWETIKPFKNGIGIVGNGGYYFLINKTGEILTREGFKNISRTFDDYFIVEKSGKIGLYSPKGLELLPVEFQSLVRETKDLIVVKKNDKVGIINDKGEMLLPLAYQKVLIDRENNQILAKNLYMPVIIVSSEDSKKKGPKPL
jgi:hypothetical protein